MSTTQAIPEIPEITKATAVLVHAMKNDPDSLRGIDESLIELVLHLHARIVALESK